MPKKPKLNQKYFDDMMAKVSAISKDMEQISSDIKNLTSTDPGIPSHLVPRPVTQYKSWPRGTAKKAPLGHK